MNRILLIGESVVLSAFTAAASETACMEYTYNDCSKTVVDKVYTKDLTPKTMNGNKYYVYTCRVPANAKLPPLSD